MDGVRIIRGGVSRSGIRHFGFCDLSSPNNTWWMIMMIVRLDRLLSSFTKEFNPVIPSVVFL